MGARFPFTSFPRGWFVVASSDELPPSGVLPLRYFGRDLVVFRGESGAVHALDAHCPHLGAHLGHGGTVCDNTIRCPFHGWRFDGDGGCAEVAGASKIPPRASVRAWAVEEINGLIMLHYPPDTAPAWSIPRVSEFGSDEWLPCERRRWRIRTHVQEIAENLVDPHHFRWVHRTPSVPRTTVEVAGHTLRSVSHVEHRTPRGVIDGRIDVDGFGLGFWAVRFTGIVDLRLTIGVTPIDEEHVDARLTFTVRRPSTPDEETAVGNALVEEISRQVDEDIPIWEHKIYLARPNLVAGDGTIMKLRKWSEQFLT